MIYNGSQILGSYRMLQSILAKSTSEKGAEPQKKRTRDFSKYYKKKDLKGSCQTRRSVFCLAKEAAERQREKMQERKKEDSYYASAIEIFFHKQLLDSSASIHSLNRLEASTEAAFLSEKLSSMVHTMNSSGITKTSMVLSSDSFNVLKDTSVTITHFDTAPSSFHIEFATNEEGARLLSASIELLQNHLDSIFTKTSFFLAKPVYHSDFGSFKRKKPYARVQSTKKSA